MDELDEYYTRAQHCILQLLSSVKHAQRDLQNKKSDEAATNLFFAAEHLTLLKEYLKEIYKLEKKDA